MGKGGSQCACFEIVGMIVGGSEREANKRECPFKTRRDIVLGVQDVLEKGGLAKKHIGFICLFETRVSRSLANLEFATQ